MKNLIFWMLLYTLMLAFSQIFLKMGVSQLGGISFKGLKDLLPLIFTVIRNPAVILGTLLMASSFFLWLVIISWFKLGLVFPMTAMVYIFVALIAYFFLGEKLAAINYLGIFLVSLGIVFLLYS